MKAVCNQVFQIESKEFNYEIRCGIYSILRYQKNSQTQGKRRIVVLIVNEDLGC